MAAAPPTFNEYLRDTIGITNAATITAINNQGLKDFIDLLMITDPDIKDICSNMKKPGGTNTNVAWTAAPVGNRAGIPQFIPNPGVSLGHAYEKRLRSLRYYCWHLKRIQRDTFVAADATLDRLAMVMRLREVEEEDDEKLALPQKLTTLDLVRDVIEDLDNYLLRKKGTYRAPLAYITRDEVGLPDALDDTGFGRPSFYDEMIRRCPHNGSYFNIDNNQVWDIVREVCHGGPGWSWVSDWQTTRNGRAAYIALKRHYLGTSFTGRLRHKADSILEKTYFEGTSRAFLFEKYCQALKGAFTDLESTGEEVHEERKVRILIKGCLNPCLDSPKNYILATETMKTSFEQSVNYLAQFLDVKKSFSDTTERKSNQRNVSGVNVGNTKYKNNKKKGKQNSNGIHQQQNNNNNNNNNKGSKTVSDNYYKFEDWIKLSADQQQRVRDLRNERDNKRRGVQAINSSKRRKTIRFEDEEPEEDNVPTPNNNAATGSEEHTMTRE